MEFIVTSQLLWTALVAFLLGIFIGGSLVESKIRERLNRESHEQKLMEDWMANIASISERNKS